MLNKSLTVMALIGSVASNQFNEIFKTQLMGNTDMMKETFDIMWYAFESEMGASSPNKDNNLISRQAEFQVNLEKIIAHNSNPERTWDMGVNKFSDMSDEEFKEYYNISNVHAPQHCSATRPT